MYVMNENTVILWAALVVLALVNIALLYVSRKFAEQAKRLRDDHMKRVKLWGELSDKEFEKMQALSDVCLHLIPLKIQMDENAVSTVGRVAKLDMKKWSKQHALGITRACGFDIEWFDAEDG